MYTATDSSNDRYGIVIDAGSSGSRLHIFKWKDPNSYNLQDTDLQLLQSVPKIEQNPDWTFKTSPGLSSFEDKPEKAFKKHIKPLLNEALNVIPPKKLSSTPIFIQATAGMRLLPKKKSQRILDQLCKDIKKSTNFLLSDCESQINIIDGELEGLYGWLSLNYLSNNFKNFSPSSATHQSLGFMDMGGASVQIAFAPSDKEQVKKHHDDIAKVTLRSLNGDLQEWDVFVSTWLGFGANQARKRYLAQLVNALPENTNDYDDDDFHTRKLVDPCMAKGYKMDFKFKDKKFTFQGSGNFEQCNKSIYPLLLKNIPCKDEPCLFNGVHVPGFNFDNDKFVGVSEYWYTANDVFKLGGPYDFEKFNLNVERFCNTDWDTLKKNNHDGKYNDISDDFLAASCFKANWVLNVLHEGFNLPKVDTNISNTELVDTEQDPIFQSLSKIDENELSWTLGRILLFAAGNIAVGDHNKGNVGVSPSENEAETLGKKFISGALTASSSSSASFITYFFRLIFIAVLAFLLINWLKSKGGMPLHLSNVLSRGIGLINFIKMKTSRWYLRFNNIDQNLNNVTRLEEGLLYEDGNNNTDKMSNNPQMGRTSQLRNEELLNFRSKSMTNLGYDKDKQRSSSHDPARNDRFHPESVRNSPKPPEHSKITRSGTDIQLNSSSAPTRVSFPMADFSKYRD
ncbi:hypothetical protein NCAS_0I00760 [Naumovozyma castellii]|uniref:Golgi apyrase n=1 Tax=Naumovozyma castellii TaxID=27288 RepID=G0VJR3_NAUCA|nr:hypothetical protein NCAS_0I00760 [Naumovozyma castellii CBS 4309]CCC71744.1 hypothetical protein NCAS_0I00760 [Naumovozyma castellii CBS 4309]